MTEYIGGWTAANKWELLMDWTIDIFRFSTERSDKFTIKIPKHLAFGIYEGYSDLHKTVIDAILYPDHFGGTDYVAMIKENYASHPNKDFKILKQYAQKTRNVLLFKEIEAMEHTE